MKNEDANLCFLLDTVRKLKAEGITILLVEQNVREAPDLADRAYVLQTGCNVGRGSGRELLESDMFREAFGEFRLIQIVGSK